MPLLLATLCMAVALSMDAFSLSILYGTLSLSKKKMVALSLIVGIFHFFMPLFGYFFGKALLGFIHINPHVLIGVIFTFIAIQMFLSLTKEEEVISLTGVGSLCIFGFTVSIDSFSVGIGLSGLASSIYFSAFLFSIMSCTFTFLGLLLGKKLSTTFGNISTLIGSILLFLLGIYYFFH